MRRLFLLVPFLLVLTSFLQLNVITSPYVSPDQLIRPLIILWLLLALLIYPAYWITRDWMWTSLLLSVFVVGFTFSSDFFITLLAFLFLAVIFWLAFARLRRVKLRLVHFMGILAGIAVFFFLFTFVLLGIRLSHVDWGEYQRAVSDAKNYSIQSPPTSVNGPDIYFIVLDGYARSDILEEMYAFDNREFISYLAEKGFVVPASNQSNYPATPLSIASTLNMEYIQSLTPSLDGIPFRWLMSPFIDHSRVRSLLEAEGYKTVSISSNWTTTENETADVYLHPYPVMLSDFEGYLLSATPLEVFGPLLGSFTSQPTAETYRIVIRYEFNTLSDLPKIPGPKFVFVHIISPHPPFAFDKDGNLVELKYPFTYSTANESPESFKRKYSDQVQFVNHNLEIAIDTILAESKTPPIILIQADHGSGLLTNLDSPENTCIRERFSPFAAYYLPGVDNATVPQDISNVNLFRLVLNEYFQAGLPFLENRQYFSRDKGDYYDFEDVTGRLGESCSLTNE